MQRSFGIEDIVKGLKRILTNGRSEPQVSRSHWAFSAGAFSLKGKRCQMHISVFCSTRQGPGCLGTPSTSSRVCRTPPSTCPSTLWRIYFREGWWMEVSLGLQTSSTSLCCLSFRLCWPAGLCAVSLFDCVDLLVFVLSLISTVLTC